MGTMRRLTRRGDTPLATWDVTDQASVDEAVAEFERQMGYGNTAFTSTGGEDIITRQFDPAATEIIIVSPFQGG